VGSQEVAPGLGIPPRRRRQAGSHENVADGARADADAQLAQFASDSQVTPARVLAGKPQGQLAHVPADGRPTWAAVRVGPAARDEPAMPRQKRLRPQPRTRPRSGAEARGSRLQGAAGPGARTAAARPGGEGSTTRAEAPESQAPSLDPCARAARAIRASGRRRCTGLTQAKATSSRRGTPTLPPLQQPSQLT